jgi:NADH:ubiquinone oxidoreductase subunit K
MYIEFLTPALMTHYLYIITLVLFLAFVGIFVISYDFITILMSTEIILLVSTLNLNITIVKQNVGFFRVYQKGY